MANLKLNKLVDKDILKSVLIKFKAKLDEYNHLSEDDVKELVEKYGFQTSAQVLATVETEIAKVVAEAPEDFNTLKELADWIQSHGNEYDALVSLVGSKVDTDTFSSTLEDYVTKTELEALAMTEAEAQELVDLVFNTEG